MTKSKTLVEKLEGLRKNVSDNPSFNMPYNCGVHHAVELARTHQDTEVQRLRDVIGKCRDLLKQYPCATDGMNSSECRACDIIAECDKVLRIS